jgi:glyoxylase-like metal-dependent hydrolase (beta-lactamase superfamily II)
MLEPLYLFHGANPLSEWRSKFLEGRPIQVDLVLREEGDLYLEGIQLHTLSLPGHSYQQFGVMVEDILFAADAYFGIDILHKHGIPFIVDAKQTMETLEKLKKLPCKGMIPGHGSFEQDYLHTINENIQVHQQIEEDILQIIKSEPAGIPLEKLVARACTYKKLLIRNASSFMLFRTAVTAYLTKMMQEKKVIFQVRDNQLLVESSSE